MNEGICSIIKPNNVVTSQILQENVMYDPCHLM